MPISTGRSRWRWTISRARRPPIPLITRPPFSRNLAAAWPCATRQRAPAPRDSMTGKASGMERLDFLCVIAGTLRIAIPLNLVLSVEEVGPLTPLPFSPDLVEGLVMALGRVLPQMPLAAALNEPQRDGGVLVVVAGSDDVRALRVDQVAGMVQVDVQSIDGLDDDELARQPLLTARFTALGAEWRVLDYVKLTNDRPMTAAETQNGAAFLGATGDSAELPAQPIEIVDTRQPLLVLDIGRESYAAATSAIIEILVPGTIRSMPGAPPWVAGLIDRRGHP